MHDTALLDLFTSDIGTAEQLLELIDNEFQALTERDLPRLDSLLNEKQPLLALLQQHGNERSRLLQSAGLSADREGLGALAGKSSLGDQLLARSEELAALLQRCQQANLRNGRLIDLDIDFAHLMDDIQKIYDITDSHWVVNQRKVG